jgi:hypothetical protein
MTPEAFTFLIAIWGALLGTIGTVISVTLAIREFRKDHPRAKASVCLSKQDPFWLISGMPEKKYVVVSVLNTGFRSFRISSVVLELSNGTLVDKGRLVKDELPQVLDENQSLDVYFDVSDIREAITGKKVFLKSACVTDAVDHKWKSGISKKIKQAL